MEYTENQYLFKNKNDLILKAAENEKVVIDGSQRHRRRPQWRMVTIPRWNISD